jgi:hypothetical protein
MTETALVLPSTRAILLNMGVHTSEFAAPHFAGAGEMSVTGLSWRAPAYAVVALSG